MQRQKIDLCVSRDSTPDLEHKLEDWEARILPLNYQRPSDSNAITFIYITAILTSQWLVEVSVVEWPFARVVGVKLCEIGNWGLPRSLVSDNPRIEMLSFYVCVP